MSGPATTAAACSVAILGGGPAGVAAALALRRHDPERRVILLAGPGGARRKIGETLPPGAQATLRSAGLWDAFLASDPLPAYGTSTAWGGDRLEDNEFILHPEGRGWHVDRARLDAALLDAAEAQGITVWRGAELVAARPKADGWRLDLHLADSPLFTLEADFALDATGRAGRLVGAAGATRAAADRLVAVSLTCALPATRPMRDTYALVESRPEGWWYSSLQPDGRLAVACFTDADLVRELRLREPSGWRRAARHTRHTLARIESALLSEETPVLRAADTAMLDRVTGPRWLAAGDAASTFDPLSSLGILKALRQGTVAGYATLDHLAGDAQALPKYEALLRREYREFRAALGDHYCRETRWPDSPFWRRRQGSIADSEEPDPAGAAPAPRAA